MSAQSKAAPAGLGMPAWAWPVLGLAGGLTLVAIVYGTCFVDPNCK